ncbi:MAG TPA: hypothetical protein ENN42_00545 [Thioalkalivibrio sp.]|nr:hypothetical protein [Thioalkalivibrio sp.]
MADETTHPLLTDPDRYQLGANHEPLILDTIELNRAAALRLAQQARRSLYIVTRDLDPAVYDNNEFDTALAELARQSRYAEIRILVNNTEPAIAYGHRLIETARRLSSYIQIRRINPDHSHCNEAYLIADRRGVLHRGKADLYEATLEFNNPARARDLHAQFLSLWEPAEHDPNFKRLHI